MLTSPAGVAWATGGLGPPVDRGARTADAWVVVTATSAALVTTVVEKDRVETEYRPQEHGFSLVAVDWFDTEQLPAACAEIAGVAAPLLPCDGHPALGPDVGADLVELRLALCAAARTELRELGSLAASALGDALRSWRPGQSTDRDIQAHVAERLEAGGADSPVLIVGSDDRVRRFRHPLAVGETARELVMAVVVARRAGLHVATTRFASTRAACVESRELQDRVDLVDDEVLRATVPGATYGHVVSALGDAYRRAGAPDAWRQHYQGGPVGFAQREFELAPVGTGDRFWSTTVEPDHAVAWNPSLPGGAKCEDTYLVGVSGLTRVTEQQGWPSRPARHGSPLDDRPAVLEMA